MAIAIREGHAFHLLFLRGRPETVARDALLVGTALSAPPLMLTTQAAATVALLRGPSPAAQTTLGVLGAAMIGGYLGEELVRHRLTPAGWDPQESSLVVAGLSLSAVMATLGLRDLRS